MAKDKSDKPKKAEKKKAAKHDAQLLVRINRTERDQFLALCDQLDTSAAREVRRFIRDFIRQHQLAADQ
ncbi:hypothetical protein GCM10011297_29540 [Bacterioplanes sanyensis]|nr:hypothetical protein GCM10011297_29540 [Bacterioplanes sanyensis]